MTATITLFSPTHSPEHIRELILTLAKEDGVDFIGSPFANEHNVTIDVEDELHNDALGWLDDVALAENLGIQFEGETLRFGDEDINFTIKMRNDDDPRLGATRIGLEPLMRNMQDDQDFISIIRYDLENPADESHFIQARSFTELNGWTLEHGRAGAILKTIVSDVDQAINTILRWMNGEDLNDLDWSEN